tara:strand:+ start:148 stop:318 length:171 start_codon:yes stop_codon:yes gene_type:complete
MKLNETISNIQFYGLGEEMRKTVIPTMEILASIELTQAQYDKILNLIDAVSDGEIL